MIYCYLNNWMRQNRLVSNYINYNLNNWQIIGMTGAIPMLVFKKLGINFVIPLTFSDGSTTKFVLEGVSGDYESGIMLEMQLYPGSSFDTDGNRIPETQTEASPYEGIWRDPSDASAMVNWTNRWYFTNSSSNWKCITVARKGVSYTTCSKA